MKFFGNPNEQVFNSDDHSLVLQFDENGEAIYNGDNNSILERLKIHFRHEETTVIEEVKEEVTEQPKITKRGRKNG